MSGWVQALPSFLQSIGTMNAGREARENAEEEAAALEAQGREASNQALRDEEAQRRAARMALGRMSAAIGEAGGGYGGSAGLLLQQSDVLAELDALNIRYGGQMRRRTLRSQASSVRRSAPSASQTNLLAGAQLLRGVSNAYTRNKVARA
jgi:hypothetical protein